jgi:hypothetical protein
LHCHNVQMPTFSQCIKECIYICILYIYTYVYTAYE